MSSAALTAFDAFPYAMYVPAAQALSTATIFGICRHLPFASRRTGKESRSSQPPLVLIPKLAAYEKPSCETSFSPNTLSRAMA